MPPFLCAACGRALAEGVIRCRFCGADTRGMEGRHQVRLDGCSVVDELLTPRRARLLEIYSRIAELAPAVAEWMRLPEGRRSPVQPDVHPEVRAELERLFAEADALLDANG